jgi:ATP-dependent DNA ligase
MRADKVPAGPQWIHEIKHDGFRLIVCRRAGRVRLFTRRGYDWTQRYPWIVAAADALTQDATIDGEVVVCDDAGIANFKRLQARAHDREAFLCAFDLLELDGVDLRPHPLEARKDRLAQLIADAPAGPQFTEHLEGDGAVIFAHACKLGFEGIVSKGPHAALSIGPE